MYLSMDGKCSAEHRIVICKENVSNFWNSSATDHSMQAFFNSHPMQMHVGERERERERGPYFKPLMG